MLIKILKSVSQYGYGYRPGFTGDVPDYIAEDLIGKGRAVALPPIPKDEIETEPEVIKAVIKKSRKR